MLQVRRETKGERRGEMVGADEVFDKWMQALASISELIERGVRIVRVRRTEGVQEVAFLPVLVVPDETLWVADYSSRGDLNGEPFQVEEVTFYLGRKFEFPMECLTFIVTHLHVMTRKAIGEFLNGVAHGGGIWPQLFQSLVALELQDSAGPAD